MRAINRSPRKKAAAAKLCLLNRIVNNKEQDLENKFWNKIKTRIRMNKKKRDKDTEM